MNNTPLVEKEAALVRREAIITSATEQVRGLLESHFKDIIKAAEQSFTGDDTKSEPTAKVGFKVKFGALSATPKVNVKVSFGATFKDESETQLDPLQGKLGV